MTHLSRRSILISAAGVATLPALRLGVAPAAAATTASGEVAFVTPQRLSTLPLSAVSLAEGLLGSKRERMLSFARGYDAARMLIAFRANANLDDQGAVPVPAGGWEGLDGEANGNLRGHFGGHFLSMLSQAWASTGEQVFRTKVDEMVSGLAEVNQALASGPVRRSIAGPRGGTTGNDMLRGSYLHLTTPTDVLDAASAVTLALWVRPTGQVNWARIFDFGTGTTRYMYLAQRNGSGNLRFAITVNGGGAEQAINGPSLPLNQWSHVAVTLGAAGAQLYVNGAQVGANPAATLTPASLGALTNTWFGRSNYPADPPFAGAFHDINIWSRALTSVEVGQLAVGPAAGSVAGAGDLASYECDEAEGVEVADSSARARHATLTRSWGDPSHPGFLAAYPETQFITLESMTSGNYTVVWAPYYTTHKIIKGLLDAHVLGGNAQALELAAGLGDWAHSRLSVLPAATLQRMWSIFSSGEFGGMAEAVCDLYALTEDPKHLELAQLFDLDSLIDSCAANNDVITGLHANQHIPIFTGLTKLHDHTGEDRYLDAARNFWGMVVPHRMYSIGGTSQAEFWRARGAVASTLNRVDNAETCCAHNMLKLSRELFIRESDPKYMDYYERTLFNQILGAREDVDDAELVRTTYFIGLGSGSVRDFTPKLGTTCCEGTGMESLTKLQDTVYAVGTAPDTVVVNLFAPSTLDWAERGIQVEQATTFPYSPTTTLTVRGSGVFALSVRIPGWAKRGVSVVVNGQAAGLTATPGSYLTLDRTWADGDTVKITVPLVLRSEPTPDDPGLQALHYGPVHLVARSSAQSQLGMSLSRYSGLSGDLSSALKPIAGSPLHFQLGSLHLAPFFEGTADPFHSYLRRSEPTIGFGGTSSGVPNAADGNGTTFLDAVWGSGPFANKKALVERVHQVSARRVRRGLMTRSQQQKVLLNVQRAIIRP
jgi:uncharacterized protein